MATNASYKSQFYDLGFVSISKKRRQSWRAKNLVARHNYDA
jgi:hypothetical protein